MTAYQITVVMPSLNEEKNLDRAVGNVMAGFKSFGINGEIIVVNDGSSDGTGSLAEGLAKVHPFVKVLHHESPQGIGASFWDGVLNATGDVVVMIPGDGENDAPETLRYLPVMEHVDIVIPFVYNKAVRSWKRRLLSRLYRGIINMTFGLTLNYMNGTVIYRTCILKDITLKSTGFFYQTELLIKSIRKGYLFAEVPYALSQRGGGASKATTLKSLIRVARNYLAILRDIHGTPEHAGFDPASVTAARWRAAEGTKGD